MVDGTGSVPVRADVGIDGDRIAVVDDLSGAVARTEIDADGWHVAPGLIDAHGHSDYTLLADGRAYSQVSQGVTTEVIGNCGHGCAPIVGDVSSFTGNIYGYTGAPPVTAGTFSDYLDRLQFANPAINTVPLLPNGNLRISCVDDRLRPASEFEIRGMKRHIDEAMDAGAWGLSLGLEYGSERGASFGELGVLAKHAADRDGLLAVHTRNKELQAVEAVEEAIQLLEFAHASVQISHILPRRGGDPDALARIIGVIESAVDRGLDVRSDVHTRLHGITHLSDALSPELAGGSADEITGALSSESIRSALSERECLISSFALGGWDRVSVFTSPGRTELVGNTIAELSVEWGMSEWDAVFEVLKMNADDVHGPLVICHSYEEHDVVATAAHPLCLVGSDATALCRDGVLADETFLGAYSWSGWIFSRLIAGSTGLSVEEAIRKLSGAVADRFGVGGRGYIASGNYADVMVFNPREFSERATLESPNEPCSGVRDVVVNGVITVQNGQQISQSGGRVLRKGSRG